MTSAMYLLPMLLIVISMMTYPIGIGGSIHVNAMLGKNKRLYFAVLKEKLSAFDASQACEIRGYDGLVHSGTSVSRYTYIRHHILKAGWHTADFIWSDQIKLRSDTPWINVDTCLSTGTSLPDPGPGMHCALADMSSDDSTMDFVITNCSEKHYYACQKTTDELSYEAFFNKTFTSNNVLITGSESACLEKLEKFNTIAVSYFFQTQMCYLKRASSRSDFVEITLEQSAMRSISYIQTWFVPVTVIHSITPAEVSFDRFQCDILSTAETGEPLSTTPTEIITTTTTPPACECSIVCFPGNITVEEIEEIKENIRKTMTIEKKTLSSYTRQLVSASDDRTSSTAIGYVGAIIMAGFLSIIVVADVFTIYQMVMEKKQYVDD